MGYSQQYRITPDVSRFINGIVEGTINVFEFPSRKLAKTFHFKCLNSLVVMDCRHIISLSTSPCPEGNPNFRVIGWIRSKYGTARINNRVIEAADQLIPTMYEELFAASEEELAKVKQAVLKLSLKDDRFEKKSTLDPWLQTLESTKHLMSQSKFDFLINMHKIYGINLPANVIVPKGFPIWDGNISSRGSYQNSVEEFCRTYVQSLNVTSPSTGV